MKVLIVSTLFLAATNIFAVTAENKSSFYENQMNQQSERQKTRTSMEADAIIKSKLNLSCNDQDHNNYTVQIKNSTHKKLGDTEKKERKIVLISEGQTFPVISIEGVSLKLFSLIPDYFEVVIVNSGSAINLNCEYDFNK